MKDKISENTRVAEIVTKYPHTRRLLEKIGVDYCCGGKHSLKEACHKAGLSQQKVIEKLEEAIKNPPSEKTESKNWIEVSLTELVEHIVGVHHAYLKENLPRLKQLSDKVYNAHHQYHGKTLQGVVQIIEALRLDIEMHLLKEEQILFPLIKEIETYSVHQKEKPIVHCGTVENPIQQMVFEHDNVGEFLVKLRKVTSGYTVPDDACESFKALYEGLEEVEHDLHEHIHLENNILFPRAAELEKNAGL